MIPMHSVHAFLLDPDGHAVTYRAHVHSIRESSGSMPTTLQLMPDVVEQDQDAPLRVTAATLIRVTIDPKGWARPGWVYSLVTVAVDARELAWCEPVMYRLGDWELGPTGFLPFTVKIQRRPPATRQPALTYLPSPWQEVDETWTLCIRGRG